MHDTSPYGYSIQGGVLGIMWIASNHTKEERTASGPRPRPRPYRRERRPKIKPTID